MSDRLDDLIGNAEPLQRAHDEGAGGELVFEAGMVLGAALGDDPRAVLGDCGRKFLNAILLQTGLHQQFNPANVLNSVFRLDPKPQRFPGLPEFPGRIRGIPHDGKPGWFFGKIFHHFTS
jgi:hypothetical protein